MRIGFSDGTLLIHTHKETPLTRLLIALVFAGMIVGCSQKPIEPPKDTKVPTAGLVEGGVRPGVGTSGGTQLKNP
jgi:hypothetical protein